MIQGTVTCELGPRKTNEDQIIETYVSSAIGARMESDMRRT